MGMKPCKTEGCTNPRKPKRRLCHDCDRKRQNAQHRERWTATHTRRWPACEKCCHYSQCKDERLWLTGLPCETLLEDEVGKEYDTNEISLRVWPAMVAL